MHGTARGFEGRRRSPVSNANLHLFGKKEDGAFSSGEVMLVTSLRLKSCQVASSQLFFATLLIMYDAPNSA